MGYTENIFDKIKEQEEKLGVKINFSKDSIHDMEHLDCVWYGGDVGDIEYKGYKILIGAYGEVRIGGEVRGEEFDFVDKSFRNEGRFFDEYGSTLNDLKLRKLLNSNDDNNYLTYENNNWFQFDVLTPDGELIDCFNYDNVIDNNIIDNFLDIEWYLKVVDDIIEEMEQ